VDVEDYPSVVAREWLGQERPPGKHVVENTRRLLELFARHDVRGTFFVLGDVAEAYPQLVRDIRDRGHELGVHGFHHRRVFQLTPLEFQEEVTSARSLIEQIAGVAVVGHRAPAYSIVPSTSWALAVLAEAGFRYDSSIFPIAGRRYGWPGYPRHIHRVALSGGRSIIEAPLSTIAILGRRVPVCGGGYLRHYPYFVTRWAMRRIGKSRPVIVYVHPYEVDTTPTEPDVSALSAAERRRFRRVHWRQTCNRQHVERRLAFLMDEFPFSTLSSVIETTLGWVER